MTAEGKVCGKRFAVPSESLSPEEKVMVARWQQPSAPSRDHSESTFLHDLLLPAVLMNNADEPRDHSVNVTSSIARAKALVNFG